MDSFCSYQSWSVYSGYIRSMGRVWRMPLFLATLVLAQGANVGTTILLGKWSESGTPGLGVPGWSRSDCQSHIHPCAFFAQIPDLIHPLVRRHGDLRWPGSRVLAHLFLRDGPTVSVWNPSVLQPVQPRAQQSHAVLGRVARPDASRSNRQQTVEGHPRHGSVSHSAFSTESARHASRS